MQASSLRALSQSLGRQRECTSRQPDIRADVEAAVAIEGSGGSRATSLPGSHCPMSSSNADIRAMPQSRAEVQSPVEADGPRCTFSPFAESASWPVPELQRGVARSGPVSTASST